MIGDGEEVALTPKVTSEMVKKVKALEGYKGLVSLGCFPHVLTFLTF